MVGERALQAEGITQANVYLVKEFMKTRYCKAIILQLKVNKLKKKANTQFSSVTQS